MKKSFVCCGLILLLISAAFSQKRRTTKPASKPKPIVFAVLDDGKTIEPIGGIDKGELIDTSGSAGDEKAATAFSKTYYKPKTTYNLIFGSATNGIITVKSSNPKSECGKNLATVTTQSTKAKLKGFVMGLATNDKPSAKTALGTRRLPTAAERAEIESLVRAEFTKQKVSANAQKKLNYYNLTALDVDNDGKAEMVGSFWVESSANERNYLFFIAEQDGGKYKFGYSEYEKVTPADIMSGDFKDLDELGGELLLDALEYDGDTTAEIFTIEKAFEGNNFHVYSRRDGKWTRVYEGYNYHCAY